MFGSKRKRAVKAAVENTNHMVDAYQAGHGVPDGFWQNDYVVGFLGLLIGCNMDTASEGKLSVRDKRRGLADAFTKLSGLNGKEIARQYTDLLVSHNSEFRRAADRAVILYLYVTEELKDEDVYPELVAIKERAECAGIDDDRGVIAANLFQIWFVDVVRSRLS